MKFILELDPVTAQCIFEDTDRTTLRPAETVRLCIALLDDVVEAATTARATLTPLPVGSIPELLKDDDCREALRTFECDVCNTLGPIAVIYEVLGKYGLLNK